MPGQPDQDVEGLGGWRAGLLSFSVKEPPKSGGRLE
jgi:hypothetical protein